MLRLLIRQAFFSLFIESIILTASLNGLSITKSLIRRFYFPIFTMFLSSVLFLIFFSTLRDSSSHELIQLLFNVVNRTMIWMFLQLNVLCALNFIVQRNQFLEVTHKSHNTQVKKMLSRRCQQRIKGK